jgi:hypothetical protein
MDCISKKGIKIMRRKRSIGIVICNATALAAGFTVFEISQRISSAKTAARAIVVENDNAAIRRRRVFGPCSV